MGVPVCENGYNFIQVIPGIPIYTVLTPLHKQYTVDLEAKTCTCPRFQFLADGECKHIDYIRRETAPKPETLVRQPMRTSGRAVEEYEAQMRANIASDFA